jgi:vacuolar-type H+-ATPase subunit E/Vma4
MKKNITELREKIVGNAEKEAETMVSRAQKARDRILSQAKRAAEGIKREAQERGKALFEKEKSRIISRKKMDEKKKILVFRKQFFELLLVDLEKELISLLKKGKLDSWIKSCCEDILKEEDGVSLLVGGEYIEKFKKICKGIKNVNFKDAQITSGFLIRGRDYEYDFRFSVLAKNILERNRKNISDKLGVNYG